MRNIKHLAIIMDGNGRWAKKKGLPRIEGHKRGVSVIKKIVQSADDMGIKYLTLYSFSTENWKRPKSEVKFLFKLMEENLKKEAENLHKNNIHVLFAGRIDELPLFLQKTILEMKNLTRKNTGLRLIFAINYGGRQEIVDAVNKAFEMNGNKKIDKDMVRKFLYVPDVPDPDIVIRTSGEQRMSNFLTWQSVYSELYFTSKLWPDFDRNDLKRICDDYQKRKRRFGGL
ncbi:MAG: isoprenyl transferase [Candidatus Omnitrophica bacterium]|nr:isoprenyl transferase [Candidatus Omnitrophota bacterium]